jgi:shikimate dehydrogenase
LNEIRQFGLIGYPLGHSFSKGYFSQKFKAENITNAQYNNYPLEQIIEFESLLEKGGQLSGLNVTIPYKEQIIPFLDELDDKALAIGAVNTIRFQEGKTIGYNTDVYGFVESLAPLLKSNNQMKALILGTGGASKAVAFGLQELDIPFLFVSGSKKEHTISYEALNFETVASHQLIVNTTPLGMFPNVNQCPPIAYGAISSEHILYDLVYNPEETLFLKRGKQQGATIKNGLEMLHLQAEKAWEIWNS